MINDIADVINISVSNPAESEYDIFVGLEHYDVGEPIITRYGSTKMLTTACKKFSAGDILLARRNVYLRRAGLVKFDGLTSGDSIVIRIKPNLSIEGVNSQEISRLLPFVLNTNAFWDFANTNSDGTMSKRLSPQMLLSYEFNLPPFSNQKPLADKLWAAYSLKASKLKLIDAIDEMVKSQFIEMFGDPVTNSKGWPTKPLSEVAPESPSRHQIEGIVWNLNLDMIESNSGKVISKIYEEVNRLLSVSQFDQGNVLFSKLRPYLNKVVVPDEIGYATTELVPLRPDQELLNKYFLAHLLRGHHFVSYANAIATGTKMPRMPMNSLRSFKCILPPMELQQQFVDIAEQADKSKFELKKSIEAIDKVIKSLINNI